METRNAIFAETWYPSQPSECEQMIQQFLKEPSISREKLENPVSGIVPHAGWFFSGAIACNVIHALSQAGSVDTVVVFGMHLHPSSPNYIMDSGAWETPFGSIRIDSELARSLTKQFVFKVEHADDFTPDNTIELQLPFIKYFFDNAQLVPIGVPPHRNSLAIGKTVVDLAKKTGKRIRVVGSTDLTHYGHNYAFTPKGTGSKALDWVKTENDHEIIEILLAMDPEQVLLVAESRQNACCAGAAATAVVASKSLGANRGHRIAYATSYDKSPGTSFVGYVGIVYQRSF